MDTRVSVHVIVDVLVTDWREDPHEDAKSLVRDVLTSAARPTHDWDGAFAIIPVAQRLVISGPDESG